MLRSVSATRYVEPFREGGSLPALCEADDDGLYVVKFRGAGQGRKALVAEVIAGELARAIGFAVPELVSAELDDAFGRAEPDPEIQDLLRASVGVNLGVDFLPGALPFAPATGELPDPAAAADVVWLDAYLTNVDRTARNTNMLWWHRRLYLIDHGACLYFHHDERRPSGYERTRFAPIREHVLLPHAGSIVEADARLAPRVTAQVVRDAVDLVPDAFFEGDERAVYRDYLCARLAAPRDFVEEAERGRS
jgi:HipA-like protein